VALTSSLFAMVCILAIIVGIHGATWGILGSRGGAPLELLTDLERRHAGRRRLLRLMPWLTGFIVCGTIGFEAASMIAAGRFDLWAAFGTLAVCGVTVTLMWWTVRRVGDLIERELRQAAEARRLLADGEEAETDDPAQRKQPPESDDSRGSRQRGRDTRAGHRGIIGNRCAIGGVRARASSSAQRPHPYVSGRCP
jgi:hypothetical protein